MTIIKFRIYRIYIAKNLDMSFGQKSIICSGRCFGKKNQINYLTHFFKQLTICLWYKEAVTKFKLFNAFKSEVAAWSGLRELFEGSREATAVVMPIWLFFFSVQYKAPLDFMSSPNTNTQKHFCINKLWPTGL